MKQALVTVNQAKELKSLGFDEMVIHYVFKAYEVNTKPEVYKNCYITNWNGTSKDLYISMPTVDEAIDWIRRKFNVVIYNSTEPVVRNKKVRYGYAVKYCNKHWGWNQRVYISRGEWSFDHYAAKRMAITKALKWIKKSKSKKETLSAKQLH